MVDIYLCSLYCLHHILPPCSYGNREHTQNNVYLLVINVFLGPLLMYHDLYHTIGQMFPSVVVALSPYNKFYCYIIKCDILHLTVHNH